MDIEKLIERLKNAAGGPDGIKMCQEAATALSMLRDENEKLRETVDKYATAARVIALHLKPFCDESLPYDEMIADAARKASDELEQVKAERDAAVEDLRKHRKYKCDCCYYADKQSRFPCTECQSPISTYGDGWKWRGQKED